MTWLVGMDRPAADVGQQRAAGEEDGADVGVAATGHGGQVRGLGLVVVGPVLLGEDVPHLGRAAHQLVLLDGRAEPLAHHFGGVEAVLVSHDPDQFLGRGALVDLHGVELVGQGLEVLDGVRALLAQRLQGQVKGHGRGVGEDGLELVHQIVGVHEAEPAHEHVDAAAAALDARHLHGDRVLGGAPPAAGEAAAGIVAALLAAEIIGTGGGLLLQPVVHPAGVGGRGQQEREDKGGDEQSHGVLRGVQGVADPFQGAGVLRIAAGSRALPLWNS